MSTPEAPESRTLLCDISWKTYTCLLEDHRDRSAPRFAYDRGKLEIMSPSPIHENMNRQIALLIQIVAQEWKIDCIDLGSTTFNREELKRGFEPDSCFYFQNAPQIRGKPEIDLTVDPAPELVVEIDITSPSLDKMPIYAQLGIPEVWRYTKNGISILHLENGVYQEQANSLALPFITSDALYDLLLQSVAMTGYEWLRAVQTWARQQQP